MGVPLLVRAGRVAAGLNLGMLLLTGCFPDFRLEDGLTKTGDITRFLAAQAADEIAAGSPILGQGGGILPPGRVSLDVKASRVSRAIPSFSGITLHEDGSVRASLPTKDDATISVGIDGALGVWKGIPIGELHTLAIEAVGALTILPDYPTNAIGLDRESRTSIGAGPRIALITESSRIPAISVGTVFRSQPRFSFNVAGVPTTAGNEEALLMRIDHPGVFYNWRFAMVKHFGPAAITAGYGRDTYESKITTTAAIHGSTNVSESWVDYADGERRSYFLGAAYRMLGDGMLGAEVVHTSNLDATYLRNSFGDRDHWSQTFVTVGVRFGAR